MHVRKGPMRDETVQGWRKLHNEELHNLYSSPNMIRMMKSWGRKVTHTGFWWKSQKERHL
jgi:acyl-coenzyme A synthetase/AMP-(fatty) acid ligase